MSGGLGPRIHAFGDHESRYALGPSSAGNPAYYSRSRLRTIIRAMGSPCWLLSSLLFAAGCARGDGGGGGGPIDPPSVPTAFTPQAGLDGAAAGSGAIRVDFTLPPSATFEVAVFVSTLRANLFTTAPHVPALGARSLTVAGLPDGLEHFIGLGQRPTTGGVYERIGPILTATPGAPLYVDAAAPAGGDGASPATAMNDLFTAVLTGFAQLSATPGVGVNVWVRGGTYDIGSTLPVTAGVTIAGGFGPAFDLASRDIESTPTIWNVLAGQKAVEYGDQLDNSLPVVVDGVRITGNGVGNIGFDTDATDPCDLELRGVVITDMSDRGLRLRNSIDLGFDVVVTRSQASRNGADGLSGNGAFDYLVYNSFFGANVQEGLDLDGLVPETGGTATLDVGSSQFFGNGDEGLDCTLRAPLVPSTGSFSVRIRGCSFELNGLAGCLIDADFEQASGYSASVLVRECDSRANAGQGFQLDLDAPLDVTQRLAAFVYRVLATANRLDGLHVTSESRPGLLVVSGSALVGNIGAGLRAEGPLASPGNRSIAVTHCLLAGNFGGGMISRDIPASATSALAYLQSSAFDANTVQVSNVSSTDPAAVAFLNAPEEYARVLSRSGAVLNLAAAPGFSSAALLELADDEIERSSISIAGATVTLSTTPDFSAPGLLAAFAPSAADSIEDYRLGAGSIALGAGLNGADAGPLGSPAAGPPGLADDEPLALFYPVDTAPAISDLVGADASITIDFSSPIEGSSANLGTVRALRGTTTIDNITIQTAGDRLTIDPPGADWGPGDFRIELDGLSSTAGAVLSGPVVLPFSR
jgi:hypothetical protein